MSRTSEQSSSILAPDALSGVLVAVSASESPDLPRLGLLDTHFRLALAETARGVLVSGGRLAYGGHLRDDGYTAFLIQEFHRYSRRDRPLRIYLAWSEHRRMALSALRKQEEDLGLFGQIICLTPDGAVIAYANGRGEEPEESIDNAITEQSLTSMRQWLATECSGLLAIGGRRQDFQGRMPGVLEEVSLFMKQGKPVYPAGGFGGATLDFIRCIEQKAADWLPELPNSRPVDQRLTESLEHLAALVRDRGWAALGNGLSDEENQRLAATHRPSEIASLISLGLGRHFSGERTVAS